jgi:hypothetical protein
MNERSIPGLAGRISTPPRIVSISLELVLQTCDDPEVPAAAAERPEQVRVPLGIDVQPVAVRGYELRGEQIIDGQAVLADKPADASSEGQPGNPDRSGVTESGRETVPRRFGGVLAGGEPGLGPSDPALRVDVQPAHIRHVQYQAAVGCAVTGQTVPAAADREL